MYVGSCDGWEYATAYHFMHDHASAGIPIVAVPAADGPGMDWMTLHPLVSCAPKVAMHMLAPDPLVRGSAHVALAVSATELIPELRQEG